MTRHDRAHDPSHLPPGFRLGRELALIAALGGLGACVVLWILVIVVDRRWPEGASAFYKGYLFAWLFWLGASLGSMTAVMVHIQLGGAWGVLTRRIAEAASLVLPALFVLFLPVLFGLHRLYPWADPQNHNPVVLHKHHWLNTPFFILRYVIYFAVWSATAWMLRRYSLRRDVEGRRAETSRLERGVSSFGLVAYFVLMTLASVDWIMSMEPEWYSTVLGFIVCMGQAVTGVSTIIIVLLLLRRTPPIADWLRPNVMNDLGNLLMVCVILWAYNSFSQLLVTWMGNTQIDIPFYVKRTAGPWKVMAAILMVFGFLTPFALLLQRGVKNRTNWMLWLCSGLLVVRMIDLYWMVVPAGGEDPYPKFQWLSLFTGLAALAGIGGVWTVAFLAFLGQAPLVPLHETLTIEHEEGDGSPLVKNRKPNEGGSDDDNEHGTRDSGQPQPA